MTEARLTAIGDIDGPAAPPGYDPAAHGVGIVHLGIGAFHRAHQAVMTDDALASAGGDWRILGVSLRSAEVAAAMNPQNGLYTLIERGEAGTRARVIGSVKGVIAGDPAAVLAALSGPAVRIVTLTITEKGYGIDRASRAPDPAHPAVAADLADPAHPTGALGLIVAALKARRAAGDAPFTVLSCDNLPENGALTRDGVVGFARMIDPDLAAWIAGTVAFPSSMVDRITPAATDATLAEAAAQTGCIDLAAIETEPFLQWVIEDHFPTGRPGWEAGGAIFVADVGPYEHMKLRMLNGAHSMLAYAGFLTGRKYVRDVMADPALAALVDRHMRAAAQTLDPLPGISFDSYRRDLLARFRNPEIAHETWQIAMDGSQKLPQRIFQPAVAAQTRGQELRPFAFAAAMWMRYVLGRTDAGAEHALRDPREEEIRTVLGGLEGAEAISAAIHDLPGLIPTELAAAPKWRAAVEDILSRALSQGVAATITQESQA